MTQQKMFANINKTKKLNTKTKRALGKERDKAEAEILSQYEYEKSEAIEELERDTGDLEAYSGVVIGYDDEMQKFQNRCDNKISNAAHKYEKLAKANIDKYNVAIEKIAKKQ